MRGKILEMVRPLVEEGEVFESETDRLGVEFRQGKLFSQETRLARGWGLRVIKDGRVGFAASTNPDKLGEMVKAAVAASAYGREAGFKLPKPAELRQVDNFDNRGMLVTSDKMVSWGRELIDALSSRVPELKVDVEFARTYRDIGLVNTSGIDFTFERAELDVTVSGLLVDDGLFWLSDYVNLSGNPHFPLSEAVERMELLAQLAKQRAVLPSGDYPVVIMPTALPSLLLPLLTGVNGKYKEKGVSPLIGQEGNKVLSDMITIIDNPLRRYGMATAPFDGEGVPVRRNVLFEQGVFKGFLFDIATAAACGVESTGSAIRSYRSLPQPGTSNIELSPGEAELGAVLRELKTGLVVYSFIGGGQSNLLAGELSVNVACGFKVENGEIVGRVKDVGIAGNVYEIFQRVDAVGSTQRDLGDYFLPFVKFSAMRLATKD